jgi:hypothetical protein
MSEKTKIALILGTALIVAALLVGGFYQIIPVGTDPVRAYRLNRFTGAVGLVFNNHVVAVTPTRPPQPTANPTPTDFFSDLIPVPSPTH